MRPFIQLTIAVAALSAAGCASRIHYPRPIEEPAAPARLSHTAAQFTYEKQQNFVSRPRHWQTDKFRVSTFAMKSIGNNGQAGNFVTAHYFQSKQTGPKPLIIVLPIWGGRCLSFQRTYPPYQAKRRRGGQRPAASWRKPTVRHGENGAGANA